MKNEDDNFRTQIENKLTPLELFMIDSKDKTFSKYVNQEAFEQEGWMSPNHDCLITDTLPENFDDSHLVRINLATLIQVLKAFKTNKCEVINILVNDDFPMVISDVDNPEIHVVVSPYTEEEDEKPKDQDIRTMIPMVRYETKRI